MVHYKIVFAARVFSLAAILGLFIEAVQLRIAFHFMFFSFILQFAGFYYPVNAHHLFPLT